MLFDELTSLPLIRDPKQCIFLALTFPRFETNRRRLLAARELYQVNLADVISKLDIDAAPASRALDLVNSHKNGGRFGGRAFNL